MLGRLLHSVADLVLNRPRAVIVTTVLAALALAATTVRAPVDLSFLAIFDPDVPLVARYLEAADDLGLSRRILAVLEGGTAEERREAARLLARELPAMRDVESVLAEAPEAWLEDNLVWMLTDEELAVLDPPSGPFAALQAARTAVSLVGRVLDDQRDPFAVESARLVQVTLTEDPLKVSMQDVVAGQSPYVRVAKRTEALLEGGPVRADWAGLPVMGAQDQQRTLAAIQKLVPLSLLVVLALLALVERRPTRLALVGLPMALAAPATIGTMGLVLGEIGFMDGFFGPLVFGLGVDYGLHLLVRQREERAKGKSFEEALHGTLVGAGGGIVAGALTTIGAFFVVAVPDDPLARHLGLAGGVGLSFCLVGMLGLLPACWVVSHRRRPDAEPEQEHRALRVPGLGAVAGFSARHPVWVLAAAALLTLAAVASFPRFHYEADLSRVFNRKVPAVATGERIAALFDASTAPWMFLAATDEEAAAIAEAIEASPRFRRAAGYAAVVPEPTSDRAERLGQILEAGGGLPDGPLSRARLEAAARRGRPDWEALPPALRADLFHPDGRRLVLGETAYAGLDAYRFREDRLAALEIHESAVGFGNFVEATMLAERPWALPVLYGILALVLTVLALDFRSLRWMAVAATPVLLGSVWTFGALCATGTGFNVMLILTVPLLIGLGVDDGIHVAHRMRESPDLTAGEAATSVGRAIVMTTATTCASFGVLLFSDHPGLESMARAMLIGLPACLLASVVVAPALAVLLRLRRG